MSYRKRPGGGLETEIEKAREEGNWKKVVELANQLKERPDTVKQFETLGWFLIGEGKLEEFLEDHPAGQEELSREKRERLKEAKECLLKTIGEDAKRLGVHLDSWILLAKLHYALGSYTDALKYYEKAQIESLEEKHLPARSLKIMAEAFAIKGLCYEKLPLQTTSKQKLVDRENKVIKCFELAGDLTLLYLQEADRSSRRGHTQSTLSMQSVGTTSGTSSSPVPPAATEQKLGPILEAALLKAPQLNLRAGRVDRAIARFRTMLSAEETRSTGAVRMMIAKQLAEVLLHGVTSAAYLPPDAADSPRRVSSRQGSADSPWKPRKYGGNHLFVPASREEEVVLLLLLAESMASKHVPLNQTPEYDTHRENTMLSATSVFNLMSLACARAGHYRVVCDMFERSLRFCPKEDHVWSSFALSLACEGQHLRALVVLGEVAELRPTDAATCLLAARLCYEKLDLLSEGIRWSEKALEREEAAPQELRARCHLYLGVGLYLQSYEVETREATSRLSTSAASHLHLAADMDPGDHLAQFYLGLHLATQRRLGEAHAAAQRALLLQPDHLPSLHLAVLVLSARGELEEASRLCNQALTEFPDNLVLLALRARLEEQLSGGEEALNTAQRMFQLLRDLVEVQGGSNDSGIGRDGMDVCDNRSVAAASHGHWDTLSDKDSASLQAQSVAASQVERTLSEVASSLSTGVPRCSPHDAAYAQIRTWLLTGELYLRLGQVEFAELCCNEARQVFPLSYLILYLRGAIHQAREEWEEAKTCFQNSLSIYPRHLSSLQALGLLHLRLGSPRLGELALRAAIRLDPTNHTSWYHLGLVMEGMEGEAETAANCFATAQAMEASAPVLPFSTIPLAFE